jgi:dephospho-CoA kinase
MGSMTASPHKPLRIGLTGGIASGKTAVADLFADQGAAVIDTDVIAREVVAPDTPGLSRVRNAFGDEILNADGSLDRSALRTRVFADEPSRRQLEAILHPLIRAETLRQSAAHAEAPYQILVVPLLAETGFKEIVDRVLVVDCPPEIQLERLIARDKESATTAAAMINAQTGRKQRLALADDTISNDGAREALAHAVASLHQQYLELAATNTR